MLIVRDLLLGPKRFGKLRQGLPKIPSNILSVRLKELERAGVLERKLLPLPEARWSTRSRATGANSNQSRSRWAGGEQSRLPSPKPGEIMNADSLGLALRDSFQPGKARGLGATFEVHVGAAVARHHDRSGCERRFVPCRPTRVVLRQSYYANPAASVRQRLHSRHASRRGREIVDRRGVPRNGGSRHPRMTSRASGERFK